MTDGCLCQSCDRPREFIGWYRGNVPESLCPVHEDLHRFDFVRVTPITPVMVLARAFERLGEAIAWWGGPIAHLPVMGDYSPDRYPLDCTCGGERCRRVNEARAWYAAELRREGR